MCGIAGIVGFAPQQGEAVRAMASSMQHRGPDSHGLWESPASSNSEPSAALAHQRLAILDLSIAGHQPMTYGPWTIVYNGEVYNYQALQQELQADGVELRSATDTEVVLQLFIRYGARCVERLTGMFAFAIWNDRTKELFAARDRMGIKPFLYRQLRDGFAFASELAPLAKLEPVTVDQSALRDFFTYKYIPTPKTIYAEITKLPPAHTLTVAAAEEPVLNEYWRPHSSTSRTHLEESAAELDQLLQEVIVDHTLSDVPVGVFLSGGVDSSTVAAHLHHPFTFNLGFDVKSHDETSEAQAIARHLKTQHTTLRTSGADLEQALQLITNIYDEPFGDHGAFPVYQIANLARNHTDHPVTVALTGEGGDELFAGYQWHDKQARLRANPQHHLLRHLAPTHSAAFRTAERRILQGIDRYATFLGPFTVRQKQSFLGHRLLENQDYDDLWAFRRHWREDLDLTKRLQWIDVHCYLRDDMMTKLDRATMAVSLEARPPLVDHRVVEFAFSLCPKLLFHEGIGKRLLRRALASRVPADLLSQRKIGFSAPVRRWSRAQPQWMKQAQRRLFERGILARPFTPLATNEQTWCVLVLDRWLENHQ